MLAATALSKQYAGRKVINGLSFTWRDAGIYLVAGANSAGKSTLLSMQGGALEPDAEDIILGGLNLKSPTKQVSDCPIFPFRRGQEWLDFVASIRGGWDKTPANCLRDAFDSLNA